MTDVPEPRGRRLADRGSVGRFLAWWHLWGQLITGLWLIGVSIAVVVVAVAFYSSQSATAQATKAACSRSRKFGPPLANAYEQYHILSPSQVKAFRDTIPKTCPA